MDELKRTAARAALDFLEDDTIIGIGTGSTVHYFMDALVSVKHRIDGCVASSKATEERLRTLGLPIIDLNAVGDLPIYIDGADEINARGEMIKGGGGALVREKIIATVARKFICIIDERKFVKRLGAFPIAIEVLPLARSFVARELVKLGGDPEYRQGFITDNGNIILDVFNLNLDLPISMEETLKGIPGVVDSGLFAKRIADKIIMAGTQGLTVL